MGIKPLYYYKLPDGLVWSSEIHSFYLLDEISCKIDETYLFGFLSGQLDVVRTPYLDVRAVPPGHCIELSLDRATVHKFWCPDAVRSLHYSKDTDYDDHFVDIFQSAVRARIPSKNGAWAELSGGLDSSSVVCAAHRLKAEGALAGSDLTTLSYVFSESTSSDEREFRTLVEEKCQFPYVHLDEDQFSWFFYDGCTVPVEHPRVCPGRAISVERLMNGVTTLLTGRGGDAIMWSMERPLLDLADLFFQRRYWKLMSMLCQYRRATSLGFMDLMMGARKPTKEEWPWRRGVEMPDSCLNWNHPAAELVRDSAQRDAQQIDRSGVVPSRCVAEKAVLDCIRLYSINYFRSCSRIEPVYPYLDRRLVEFMLSIPIEQKIKPGRSRVLHRRALKDMLPVEIAERRSKAGADEPICRALRREWSRVRELLYSESPMVVERNLVRWDKFTSAVEHARHGRVLDPTEIIRVLALEAWMRQVSRYESSGTSQGFHLKGGDEHGI